MLLTYLLTNVTITYRGVTMGFQENLRQLLNDVQLKQADLCRMTGIQTSLMSDYLGGKKSPTIGNAILIADALHISLDTLVGKEPVSGYTKSPEDKLTLELIQIIQTMSKNEKKFLLDVAKAFQSRISP